MSAHHALFDFHQERIALTKPDLDRLRDLRDKNVERLREGLGDLGRPTSMWVRGQGGYAMSTLTQRDDGNQDIDVALIFNARDLPARPAEARSLIHAAVLATAPGTFHRAPERRTNAVTVWYTGGYHIDFAVYRSDGGVTEHAGPTWERASPAATVRWFLQLNARWSPKWSPGALVNDSQLRRVVRFMKYLRQGEPGDYPGGYIITALACRNYQPSADGDDVALAATLARVAREIESRRALPDPIAPGRPLLRRDRDNQRLYRYGALLERVLRPLRPLFDRRRRRVDAVGAWEQAIGVNLRY
jgi:hypothetical protein